MTLGTIIRTESLGNFRDRRAMLTAFVFGPVFGPALFVGLMTLTVNQVSDQATHDLRIPILGAEHAPNLVSFLEQRGIVLETGSPTDSDALQVAVRDGEHELGVIIPPDANASWREGQPMRVVLIADRSDSGASSSIRRVTSAIESFGSVVAQQRLVLRGIPPSVVQPIVVDEIDVSTPSGRSVLILGMLTYVLLLTTLTGGVYHAVDTTGGERERGSLEPLLSLPVPRFQIALGKVLTSAIFMAASMVLTLLSYSVAIRFLPLADLGMSADFGPAVVLGSIVAMIPFAVLGATLMNTIGAFAKTYKEAQSYVNIAMLVPTLPIAAAAVLGVDAELALMVIPSMSQHLIITELIKGNTVPWSFYAVCWIATIGLSVAMMAFLIRRYRNESLLG